MRVEHDLLVLVDDIDDVKLDPQLLRHPKGIVALGTVTVLLTDRMGMAFDAEAGVKIDPFDVHALILHHLGGQQGIESTGNQSQSPALMRHCSLTPRKNTTL